MRSLLSNIKLLRYTFNRDALAPPLEPFRIPYTDLTLVMDGELCYRIDGKDVTVRSGDAILLPQGAVRERLPSDSTATYASFNVELPEGTSLPVCGRIKGALFSDTVLLLEKVEQDLRRVSPHSTGKSVALFTYVLMSVLEKAGNEENVHIEKIKQYVHDNISEPLSLSIISESIHLVPRYVCTLFKREVGITLTEYILRQRISLAKKLIVTSQLALSEICGQCGFTDYNYFSRSFKRITGMTAAFYKKSKFKEI